MEYAALTSFMESTWEYCAGWLTTARGEAVRIKQEGGREMGEDGDIIN